MFAGFWLKAIIAIDEVDIEITHLATHMLNSQIDGVLHVFADNGSRCGECCNETNFNFSGMGGTRHERGCECSKQGLFDHLILPICNQLQKVYLLAMRCQSQSGRKASWNFERLVKLLIGLTGFFKRQCQLGN